MIIDDATTIASILDLQNKHSFFELDEPITKVINALQDQFSLYSAQQLQSQISPQENSTSSRDYFRQLSRFSKICDQVMIIIQFWNHVIFMIFFNFLRSILLKLTLFKISYDSFTLK